MEKKNFSKYTLDRGLASRIYKELKDGTPRKQPNSIMGYGTEQSSQKTYKRLRNIFKVFSISSPRGNYFTN